MPAVWNTVTLSRVFLSFWKQCLCQTSMQIGKGKLKFGPVQSPIMYLCKTSKLHSHHHCGVERNDDRLSKWFVERNYVMID